MPPVPFAPLPEPSPGEPVPFAPLPEGIPPPPADPRAIPTVLSKPASGGKPGDTGGHSVRVAIVFGLADLFFDYGQKHSAAELYQFYTELRVFAYRRANTRPKSRMVQWKRSSNAGLWRQRGRGRRRGLTQWADPS